MTNAFILCNLLLKVQKSLAANREGSFNIFVYVCPTRDQCYPCVGPANILYMIPILYTTTEKKNILNIYVKVKIPFDTNM